MASRDQLRKLNSSPIVFGGLLAGAAIGSVLPVGALLGAWAEQSSPVWVSSLGRRDQTPPVMNP